MLVGSKRSGGGGNDEILYACELESIGILPEVYCTENKEGDLG